MISWPFEQPRRASSNPLRRPEPIVSSDDLGAPPCESRSTQAGRASACGPIGWPSSQASARSSAGNAWQSAAEQVDAIGAGEGAVGFSLTRFMPGWQAQRAASTGSEPSSCPGVDGISVREAQISQQPDTSDRGGGTRADASVLARPRRLPWRNACSGSGADERHRAKMPVSTKMQSANQGAALDASSSPMLHPRPAAEAPEPLIRGRRPRPPRIDAGRASDRRELAQGDQLDPASRVAPDVRGTITRSARLDAVGIDPGLAVPLEDFGTSAPRR